MCGKKVAVLVLTISISMNCLQMTSFAENNFNTNETQPNITIGSSEEEKGINDDVKTSEKGLYIRSSEIPVSVVEYAIDMFQHLNVEDLELIGISANNADQVHLAKGFTILDDNGVMRDDLFYFPVLNNEDVVALLTVYNHKGNYGFTFGQDMLSDSLDMLQNQSDNPYQIVATGSAYFSVRPGEINTLGVATNSHPEDIEQQKSALYNLPKTISDSDIIVNISANEVYDQTVNLSKINARTQMRLVRTVEHLNNILVGTKYTCWAATVGTLASFYNHSNNANDIRWSVINEYGNSPNLDGVQKALEEKTNKSFIQKNGLLVFGAIKVKIANNNLFLSCWETSDKKASHTIAVHGYSYDNADPTNVKYQKLYLEDSNEKSSGKIVSYNTSIPIIGVYYDWTWTVYR